ncbi:proline-rich proteoglycan 2-like [Prionailurus bengalensis]|uniref:proline-rich proteoglycan 2-like n=1 Tax=Prionailurus bengalensis TaxID=37029 RepID=UPI001CA8451A|nr:proline-rich proteoglycan 2-like [Prionailurus bengalensis]
MRRASDRREQRNSHFLPRWGPVSCGRQQGGVKQKLPITSIMAPTVNVTQNRERVPPSSLPSPPPRPPLLPRPQHWPSTATHDQPPLGPPFPHHCCQGGRQKSATDGQQPKVLPSPPHSGQERPPTTVIPRISPEDDQPPTTDQHRLAGGNHRPCRHAPTGLTVTANLRRLWAMATIIPPPPPGTHRPSFNSNRESPPPAAITNDSNEWASPTGTASRAQRVAWGST